MIDNEIIMQTVEQIKEVCTPYEIILISQKVNTLGNLTGFKLALIMPDDCDVQKLECKLYMEVDTDLPCDYVLYRKCEWDELRDDVGSFAWKIDNSGVYLV